MPCVRQSFLVLLFFTALSVAIESANAAETDGQLGKYLVSIIPCTDCHTPGTFLGRADMKRYLGGSDVGFEVPGLGVFYAPNLTPDKETGPFGVREKPSSFVYQVLPPDKYVPTPPPPSSPKG